MPSKKGGSGLVFSSDSLKEFLGSSSKAGVSKKRTQILAAEQSNAIVQEILREESLDQTSRLRGLKKKSSSKSIISPKEANRCDNDERSRKEHSKRVPNTAALAYNVHTFGSALGLVGDDISYLEKLYLRIKCILEVYREKLVAGYEQLVGDQDEFTASDAELLLAFAEIEVDDVIFHSISGQLTPSRSGKKVENIEETITLDFDQWLIAIISNARRRLMTCALGSKYGHSAPTYLDKIDHLNSVNSAFGSNSGRIAGGGKGVGKSQEQSNNIVVRTARGSTKEKESVPLREGTSNRPSPLKSSDRGYDFTSSCFLKSCSTTMDAPTLGSDSSSYCEDIDGDAYEAANTYERNEVGVVDDVYSMFDEQRDMEPVTGSRPSSPVRRHTLSNELDRNLKADWSRIIASRSVTSMAYPSMGLKGPLAPVRAQQMKSKAAQKRMLLSNGFNESFGRATPRCLKNDQLGQASSFNGLSNSGLLDGYRSFGGAARDGDVQFPVLTDAKSIMDNVEVLKKELALAEAGAKYLDNRVDEDIVWVHSHCEIPSGSNAMSIRAVGRCRKLAMEKMFMVLSGYTQNTLLWALLKWRESCNYDRLKVITAVYSRAKGIELLCKVTHGAMHRQLSRGWVPWLKGVKAQKRAERYAAATEICRMARGYLGRNTAKNMRLHRASITIQRMVRRFLSRKSTLLQQQRSAASDKEKPRLLRPIEDVSVESAVERYAKSKKGGAKDEREERRRVYAAERAALRADAASRDIDSNRERQSVKDDSLEPSTSKARPHKLKKDIAVSASNSKVSSADNSVRSNRSRSNSNSSSSSSSGASKRKSINSLNDPTTSQSTTPDDSKISFFPNIVEKVTSKKLSDVREEDFAPSPEERDFDPEISSEKVGGDTEGNKGSDVDSSSVEERERAIRRVLSECSKDDHVTTLQISKVSDIDIIPSPSHHKSPNSASKIQLKGGPRTRPQRRSLPSLSGHKHLNAINMKKSTRNDPAAMNSILDSSHASGRNKPDNLEKEQKDTFNSFSTNSSTKRNHLSNELKSRKKSASSSGEYSAPHSSGIPYSRNGLGRPYSTNALKILPSNLPPVPSPKFAKSSKFVHSMRSMTPPAPLGMVEDESPGSLEGKKGVMSPRVNLCPTTSISTDAELTDAPPTFDSNITPITDLSCFVGGCETTSASLNTMETLTPGCGYIAMYTQSSNATITTELTRALDADSEVEEIEAAAKSAAETLDADSSSETFLIKTPGHPNESKQECVEVTIKSNACTKEEEQEGSEERKETLESDFKSIAHDEFHSTASSAEQLAVAAAAHTLVLVSPSSSSSRKNSRTRAMSGQDNRTEGESMPFDEQAPSSSRRQSEADAAAADRELYEDRLREQEDEAEREREREEDLCQQELASIAARQREEEEEEERRRDEEEQEKAEKERERIRNLRDRIEAAAEARRREKLEDEEKERERERVEDLRRREEASIAERRREEEEDRQRREEEEAERERERAEDLRQKEVASIAARRREEEEQKRNEDERIRNEEERRKNEEEEEVEKERGRINNVRSRMEATMAARRKEKADEERRKNGEDVVTESDVERSEDLRRREEASIAERRREEEEDRQRREEEEAERERERAEDLRQKEVASIAAKRREEEEEEDRQRKEQQEEAERERERAEDQLQRELASIAAKRREEEREREIVEDQRIRQRISDNKLSFAKAQEQEQEREREKLRESERLREEALRAQKEKSSNFGIVKGIAAILKHDKGKITIDAKNLHDKELEKEKGADLMPTKNASEINEEDVMLLAKQLNYSRMRTNRSLRGSATRIPPPKPVQQSSEGSVRRPQPPDDGNPGRPRPPDDMAGRRRLSDDSSLRKFQLADEPVCVRARMRSEDSLPSMSKPPLHSDDCSSIGSRRRRSSSISPLVKNSPKPSAGESLVDEKIRLLDEKLQKLEAVEKRVEERERAMEIARKVTENKALALEIRMLEFEERNRLSACALGSEPILTDLGSVRSSFPRGERTPFDRNMSFSEGPASSASATRHYRHSSSNSGFASSSSHSRDRADGSRRHTPRRSQLPAPVFGTFPHLLPVPQGLPRCTHEGVEWVFLHDNITNRSFWYCESATVTQWMKPGLGLRMEIDTSNSDDRSGVCRSISAFEEEDHGYLTDNASVMTDCTSDSNNNSQNGSEVGDGERPEWQEFWDEQAQGKYWYNNISGEASWTKPFSDQFDSGTNTTPVGGMDPDNLDWISSVDDATGQEYWYNVKTGESSWA